MTLPHAHITATDASRPVNMLCLLGYCKVTSGRLGQECPAIIPLDQTKDPDIERWSTAGGQDGTFACSSRGINIPLEGNPGSKVQVNTINKLN